MAKAVPQIGMQMYTIRCTHCGMERPHQDHQAANLQVGDPIPYFSEEPSRGHCSRCKRWEMTVVKAPKVQPKLRNQGFTPIE